MPSLLDLPTEILSIIVHMARDQDERLYARLARSRKQVEGATRQVMAFSEWYGKSLLALHATCKTLEGLAKPHVLESVRLSKSDQPIFLNSIIPSYAPLIKSAIFDLPLSPVLGVENFRHLVNEFIDMFRDLPAVQNLTFETAESITEFQLFCRQVEEVEIPATAEARRKRACRPLFASLVKRVTHLVCLNVRRTQMIWLVQRFPNLRYVKRRLHPDEMGPDDGEDDGEREAFSALQHLEEIDLSTLNLSDEIDLKRLREYPAELFQWSELWKSLDWPSVKTLRFNSDSLTLADWEVLKRFSDSLECLEISCITLDESLKSSDGAFVFPKLATLSIMGDEEISEWVLRSLKLAPIATLEVRLVSTPPEDMQRLFCFDATQEWSATLKPFGKTLRRLKLDACGVAYSSEEFLGLKEQLEDKDISFERGGVDEGLLLYEVDQPIYSVDLEEHQRNPGDPKRTCSKEALGQEVKEVIGYLLERLAAVQRNDDTEGLNSLARILSLASAMRLMERE